MVQRLAAQFVPRLPLRSVRVPGFLGKLHNYEAMGSMRIGDLALAEQNCSNLFLEQF
jgi:hypothetical protein